MTELTGVARFTLDHDRVEDFKRLSKQCMDVVRELDTGTLQYDIFLSDDATEAMVIERYRDSEAHTEHLAHIGEKLMGALLNTTASVEGWTLGNPSDEVRAQLETTEVRLLGTYLLLDGAA